ncbi:MAG: hypothetical protein PHP98_01750 [Kiritimatiellae bacterium]|jgi:hypothetical protein|nr:hypothetical protein [Kiritimatiellia bacterium]
MNISHIVLFTLIFLGVLFILRWIFYAFHARDYLRYINKNPDKAYDFFTSDPEMWTVFEIAEPELIRDHLPSSAGLPQGKLLGPFQFRVPKRHNRIVTVYGKSRKCLDALDQLVKNGKNGAGLMTWFLR